MHHATGLYAHITWHTWRRQASIRRADVETVSTAVLAAAKRTRLRVHAQAVLADHVHLLVSFPPDATISAFVREAKSESSRRARVRWCRGYYAGSLDRRQVRAARIYIGRQYARHPGLVPT
jgi:REP-associated tyrosine transposase